MIVKFKILGMKDGADVPQIFQVLGRGTPEPKNLHINM